MKTNQQRADAAEQAVALYNTGANNEAEVLCDLLCDLQHLCARDPSHGLFQDALRLATAHFLFEKQGSVVPFGEPVEVPTVVIDIEGSAVHSVRSNRPMRVVILDADTQGSDGKRIQTIEGFEVYVHDRKIQ